MTAILSRADGERIRARHALARLRACLEATEIALRDDRSPVGYGAAQAVTETAVELAMTLARLDAYARAERGGGRP